jgi:hypothetical protein
METNKVMHKNMHTNVLRFRNTWEKHEAINLRISVDFKLETLKFTNEYFENTKYKIPNPCLVNTSPNMQKLEFYSGSNNK